MGPHCSFCGTFTGPFSEIEGLFTVLICIPSLEVRQARPDTLLGLHDPGSALGAVGLSDRRLRPLVPRPLGPGGHTTAEHPGWTVTYELLRSRGRCWSSASSSRTVILLSVASKRSMWSCAQRSATFPC